jgi:polyvinyl alcohol dehydrogenase (cytochrome)
MLTSVVFALAIAQAPNGATVYADRCAMCHTSGDPRTPKMDALKQKTPAAILDALNNGVMRQQASEMTEAEKRAVAEFLGSAAPATPPAMTSTAPGPSSASTPPANMCASTPPFDPTKGPAWNGWGVDLNNQRFQPAAQAGISAEQVPKLTLKWAFGFPNASTARGLPTIAGGRVFVGSQSGTVYALDAKSGCTIWTFKAQGGVRAGIVIGPRAGSPGKHVAYFGDARANQYAVDAATGELIWTRHVDEHVMANLTGTAALYQGRLYVPVASGEEAQGGNAKYECCTFRGSLVALDAATGSLIWKTYTIAVEAKPIGKNSAGTTRWGPSGGGVWSAPTVDPKRKVVYAATGNMYTEPQQPTSDSIVAFDLDTGKIAWVSQVSDKDIFVVGCGALASGRGGANCPSEETLGPDHDFGNAPILVKRPDGKDVIVAGQKSGIGWAFDPDNKGKVLWQYRAGKGGALGGLEFGSAVDNSQAYFAVSDTIGGGAPGGLHAVKLNDGTRAWFTPPETPKCGTARGCNNAILAAITVIPGVVFTGSNDGAIRGYSTKDGSLLWEYDTNHEFQTVNGVPAKGASISGPGPTVAGGMLFVNSGYGALGGRPGNVLLAFGIE